MAFISSLNTKNKLLIIIAFAILVRLIFVFIHDPIPEPYLLNLDDVDWDYLGKSIADGDGLTDKYGQPTTTRFPVYPCFLGIIYAIFGYNITITFVIQAIFGSITVLLSYLIAREFFQENVSIIAAVISAVYPSYVAYTARLMSETVFIPLVALLILVSIKLYKKPAFKIAALTGFVVAFTSLCRGVTVPLMIIAPVFALFFARGQIIHRVKIGLTVGAITLLTLTPWIIRNYIQFDKIFLTSSEGGPVLWMSYFPIPAGDHFRMERAYAYVDSVGRKNAEIEEFHRILVEDNVFGLTGVRDYFIGMFPEVEFSENEVEFNDQVIELLKEQLKEYPGYFVVKHVKEFLKFWHFVNDRGDYVIAYGLILPFFLTGLWLLRRRFKEIWLLHLFFVYIWIMETAFMSAARFRLPFEIVMIVIGSYAVYHLFIKVRPVIIPVGLSAIIMGVNIWFSLNDNAFRQVIRSAAKSVGIPVIEDSDSFFPDLPQDSLDASPVDDEGDSDPQREN